jgi:hypothetical protein
MTCLCCGLCYMFQECYRITSIPSKLNKMKVPLPQTTSFIETSMFHEFRRYFDNPPEGVTVFWAPKGSGKTFTLSQISPKNTVYWNCRDSPNFEETFYSKLGLNINDEKDMLFEFCKQKTFVLTHFEYVTDRRFLYYMCRRFSILLLCDTHECALDLAINLRPRPKILGPPFCGRWNKFQDTSDISEIRACILDTEWVTGELAIGLYRMHDTVFQAPITLLRYDQIRMPAH